MTLLDTHGSSFVMVLFLFCFAVIHSGGAALRVKAESVIGARAWRLIFAFASIPSAVILVGYFIAHRYDGVRFWNFQGISELIPVIWILSAISFLFLYPATYNLLEIPAVLKPKVRIYASGIIRVTRHPQAIGQIIWCFAHLLWIGTSFTLVTCVGLMAHHLFAIWHGDRRLTLRFGKEFDEIKKKTSVVPFLAVLDGRQKLQIKEFLRPSQMGILIAIFFFWWSHKFISVGAQRFLSFDLTELLARIA